jgi:hypothetical protein
MTLRAYRRFEDHKAAGHPLVLPADHRAIVNKTTLFPGRIEQPHPTANLFKSGKNNRKIGSHVTKGMWKGMPIYTLTLEERATCPTICEHWHDCFGNKMHWSTRWHAGARLERLIPLRIEDLAAKHKKGFVVRLHVLGDFYSVPYMAIWNLLLAQYPGLRVFGYTRREKNDPIGRKVNVLNGLYPDRWRIRWSERGGIMGTVMMSDVTLRGKVAEGIVCPAQTEDALCCGTCGLCWNSEQPIVFINH